MSKEAASQCTAGHGGHHETRKDHAVRQVLAIWAEGRRPQEHKGVHAALKQGLHGTQQPNPGICTGTAGCHDEGTEAHAVTMTRTEPLVVCLSFLFWTFNIC